MRKTKENILKLPKKSKKKFSDLYKGANPVALDLLEKMLTFHPKKRITIKECLEHPYFTDIRDQEAETTAEKPFDWSFDEVELTKENLQKMIYEESLNFHKENEE